MLPPGVRTFHPRRGRLTPAQKERTAALLVRYGIPAAGTLDLAALFAQRPTAMEIGFGMGEATYAMAVADPATAILAVDIHTPGVLRLLGAIEAADLTNVRVAHEDALELLRTRVLPGSLDAIRVYFPDPWPKARHHKRRLVQPRVVALLASRLRVGGTLHLATDVPEYAEVMLAVLSAEPLLHNDHPGPAPRPEHRPLTRYESQGLDREHPVTDLVLRRV